MDENNFEIKKASEFTADEISKFKKVVIDEGEVIELTFDGLIQKNPILLFYPNTTDIKAVGALKKPYESYKSGVFKKSNSPLKSDSFDYELGWIVVLERGQGIGKKITKVLADFKDKVYSTVRAENEVMNHILTKIGFEKSGETFDSKRKDYKINLYVLNK